MPVARSKIAVLKAIGTGIIPDASLGSCQFFSHWNCPCGTGKSREKSSIFQLYDYDVVFYAVLSVSGNKN